jgi:hypothetical protein
MSRNSLHFDANFTWSQKEVTACYELEVWCGRDQSLAIIGPKTAAQSRVSSGTVFVQKRTTILRQFASIFTYKISTLLHMHQLTVLLRNSLPVMLKPVL